MYSNQLIRGFVASLAVACFATVSLPVLSQSRACLIDERTGALHCGWPADQFGRRMGDYNNSTVTSPVYNAPRLSQEQAQDQVNRMYQEVLGRSADYASLRQFADQLIGGRSLSDLRIELATSPEAYEAIRRIYREVLGREADSSGLEAQINELRKGNSLGHVRSSISQSPEARNRR